MENKTAERIKNKALEMFAERGYKGTNLRDLAAELNLSKSALYRYYDSKDSIWRSLVTELSTYYELHFGSAKAVKQIPQSCEELKVMTLRMVDFTIHDKRLILTRKILLTEQFHNKEVRNHATQHFNVGLKCLFDNYFKKMIECGILRKDGDPSVMALAYTGPITVLIHLCDREPEREKEVLKDIERFIDYFILLNKA